MSSIHTINRPLRSLIIGHTFLVLLLPLLGALFYYSTPQSRQKPIFILNVLALALALFVSISTDYMDIHAMLSPQIALSAEIQITTGAVGLFQGMLVDAILLVRLMTVYPLRRIGFKQFALLTSLPITLKVARIVNTILFIDQLSIFAKSPNASRKIADAWITMPYLKIEWIAQVVDNSYVSIAFLWTIWNSRTDTASEGLSSDLTLRQSPISERIRFLFNIALSNFVIPTLISFAELLIIFRVDNANRDVLNAIAFVNPTISAFGVVFATVWAGKEHRRQAKALQEPSPVQHEHRIELDPVNLMAVDSHQHDDTSFVV